MLLEDRTGQRLKALLTSNGIPWEEPVDPERNFSSASGSFARAHKHGEKTLRCLRLLCSDPRIVDRGRRLLEEIRTLDENVDQGNGAEHGLVRWYTCGGIDCDEGWEQGF